MKKIEFINDDIKVSRLGFGLMRLPVIENDNGQIDYKKSRELVESAIENGITYFDTAYVYHNNQSEIFAGEMFRDGLREKLYLATKLPVWKIDKEEDFFTLLDTELQRLQTDYIDFYLLHSLDKNRFNMVKEKNVYHNAMKSKAEGKIRYLGFSFHDDISVFKEIIDTYDFDFCQIQLNYLDENYQAGLEGMRYAKSKGLGVVVMEPLRGGQLARLPQSIIDNLDGNMPAELALSYLYNMPEVDVVLSGMNELFQIEENSKTASEVLPDSLSKEILEKIDYLKNEIHSRIKVDCTRCNYCMPCPTGVKIPSVFAAYNNKYIFEDNDKYQKNYKELLNDKSGQPNCIECGQCEDACPQHLSIIEDLKKAHKDLIGGIE
ncbi:MAG: aldo/keto reductase [Tissierellia bacterium]|nr:aldo/keto reductase [Tissierellia bacterium]